jgi:SPP1 family predicted phage head-tail adaptor
MRAGKLDRSIIIERVTPTPDSYGVPMATWATLATLRAELIEGTTDEFIRESGASTEATLTFRTRFLAGVTLADRITFEGAVYNIKQLKEVGRRRGLEIHAVKVGP